MHFHFLDCEAPSTTVTTTKEELLLYFKQMYTMRRMEIVNDTEYKVIGSCVVLLISPFSSLCLRSLFPVVCRLETFVDFAICTMARRPSLPACTQP